MLDETYGIDATTRSVRWHSRVAGPRDHTSFSVLPDGTFIATGGRGTICALRPDNGDFVWETSQVLGLVDHDTTIDITPVAAPDGRMYGASYRGFVYHFSFPSQGTGR